ncbi:MAG: hypothetical protein B6245_17930 [Desulfobacteraceae bacterium 4572_88]|nr:MAG: hypothetical protein B6245_17930 [Desulfobacteraceae bacterium 4572_88]
MRKLLIAMLCFSGMVSDLPTGADAGDWQYLRINEIMAEDGDYADWTEIYNTGDQPVSLDGLYLSDDLEKAEKWAFPSDLIIAAKGFRVLWADGMDSGSHTSFKLKQKGENIGLFDPEGTLIDSLVYEQQVPDVSFGRHPDGGSAWPISTDPANLWDEEMGIYTEGANYDPFEGKANYLEDWERPVSLEFYEPGGMLGFSMNAGMKIHGGSSRDYLQKSVSVHARERFGNDEIQYKLFPDEDIETFKSFILRNDGCCDDERTLFRDAILHLVLKDQMDMDLQAYRPTVVYLNGAYWGILNLREKLNEDYLASHHDADPDAVDILEESRHVVEGDAEHYENLSDFVASEDMASDENYEYVRTQMDTDEYINYQIAEIYSANSDWPGNNIRYWRPQTPDGKWRWLLYDTDYAFVSYEYEGIRKAAEGQPLFSGLLKNAAFRNELIQRLASHLNTTFLPDQIISVIDRLRAGILEEVPNHIRKWGGTYGSYSISTRSQWEDNIEIRRTFARRRPAYARQHITDYFGLSGTANLTLKISEPCSGEISVQEVAMPGRHFTGTWFRDVPLRLKARANPGWRFTQWQGIPGGSSDTLSLILTGDFSITAMFERISPVSDLPGDVHADGYLTLCDAILALQVCSGLPSASVISENDVDGDGRIGMAEVVYVLRKIIP